MKNTNSPQDLLGLPFGWIYMALLSVSAISVVVSIVLHRSIFPPLLIVSATIFASLCVILIKRGQRLSSLPLGPDALILGLMGPGIFLSGVYLACYEVPSLIGLVAHSHSAVLQYAFKSLFLCFAGLAGFALGYYTWPKNFACHGQPGERLNSNRIALFIALGLAAIGVLVALQYIRVRGGIVNFMQVWNDRDTLYQMPIYDRLIAALPMATVIILCSPIRRRYYWLLAVPITLFAIYCMYATGGRHNVLRLSFACFITLLFTPQYIRFIRKHPIPILMAGFVFFILVYISVGVLRGTAGSRIFGGGDFYSDAFFILGQGYIFESLLSSYYLPSLVPVSMAVHTFPDVFGFARGDSFLAALDVYVPKLIWSDFPNYQIGKTLRVAIFNDDADSGLYASYIGELWANFSYFGPFIGMLVLGFFARLVMSFVSRDSIDPLRRAFYAITFGSVVPMFLVVNAKPAAYNSVFLYIFLIIAWGAFLLFGGGIKTNNFKS